MAVYKIVQKGLDARTDEERIAPSVLAVRIFVKLQTARVRIRLRFFSFSFFVALQHT